MYNAGIVSQRTRSDAQVLYLTTTGRKTGLPREIEIWFVASGQKYYILAEFGLRAQWVRNLLRDPRVRVRIGSRSAPERAATARVLNRERDAGEWQTIQRLSREKYGWGDGMPVEITPDA
jgi:deazaflavin-dependent oxidoreductase (nitroreductase family)